MKMQYCGFDRPAIVMGGGVDDENCGQKIEYYEVSWLSFNIYRHLAELHDEVDTPRSKQ